MEARGGLLQLSPSRRLLSTEHSSMSQTPLSCSRLPVLIIPQMLSQLANYLWFWLERSRCVATCLFSVSYNKSSLYRAVRLIALSISPSPSPMPYERSIPLSRATTPGSTANYAESSYTDGDEGDIDDISSRIASPAFSVVGRSELSRIRPAPASTPLDQEEKRTYEPVAPVNADLSGWEAGFESYEKITKQRQSGSTSPEVSRSASASGSASGKNIDDQEQFDGLYKLNSRDTPSAHPPDRVVVPPKPVKAWTFKDEFFIAPGGFVDPREIARPSQEYEQLADKFSQSYHKSNFKGKRPKLVVMDLANVLCYRNAGKAGARNARMRPYLSAFLTYLCGTEDVGGKIQRRFSVMVSDGEIRMHVLAMLTGFTQVWSSAEPKNAKTMCEGIGLIHQGLQETTAPLIVDVWARDSMDLLPGQYDSRYATIKNLDKVWKAVEWDGGPNMRLGPVKASERSWSQADTILIDDQVHGVSSTQPFNHLPMQPWNKESAMTVKNQEPDRYLLRMIGALEELRCESNVSNALKLRPFGNVGRRWGHGGEAWEEKGRKILKSLSIKAEEFFDRDWASKMLGVS